MHKIDGVGATVDNRFTEGNEALSIPATEVTGEFMNAVQGELVTIIQALGITLKTSGTDTEDQVYAALRELSLRGGRPAPIAMAVANNQASPADVTGFPTFLTTEILTLSFLYRVFRKTDSGYAIESGNMFFDWNPEANVWIPAKQYNGDGAGVDFSLAATGTANQYKLQYASDSLAGASYTGFVRITDIVVIRA